MHCYKFLGVSYLVMTILLTPIQSFALEDSPNDKSTVGITILNGDTVPLDPLPPSPEVHDDTVLPDTGETPLNQSVTIIGYFIVLLGIVFYSKYYFKNIKKG